MNADTESGASPGRPRSEQAHKAILDATLELLAEAGFSGLTVEGVAARASVGKATIYRRWPSKLPLAVEAYSQLPELQAPDMGNLADDIRAMLRNFVKILGGGSLAGVLPSLAGERLRDPELSEVLEPWIASRRKPLTDVIRRGIERGELPEDIDVELAADLVVGPFVTRVFFSGDCLDESLIEPVTQATLTGIRALRR